MTPAQAGEEHYEWLERARLYGQAVRRKLITTTLTLPAAVVEDPQATRHMINTLFNRAAVDGYKEAALDGLKEVRQ